MQVHHTWKALQRKHDLSNSLQCDCTNSFSISNDVKQGCVLVLVLFNFFFSQVLLHTVKDLDLDVYVKYRSDGSVFDLRLLSSRTKTVENS